LNQSKLLLRVKNLAVHFPSDGKIIKAVDEISFEIDEGEPSLLWENPEVAKA
jgi:ABC-type oligopeptide transport system ATPase subunit